MRVDLTTAYNQGLKYAREGKLAEARASLRQVLKADPEHIEAHNLLGKVSLHLGDLQAAASHWERALAIDPTHPTPRECLKVLHRSQWVWLIRSLLRGAGVLILAILVLIIAWQYDAPGRAGRAVSAMIQLPGQLRAQPAIDPPVLPAAHRPPDSDAQSPEGQDQDRSQDTASLADARPESAGSAETADVATASPETVDTEPVVVALTPVSEIRSAEQLRVVYDRALAQFRRGEVEQAQAAFQAILDSGVTSSLLDNAQYWLAECYASQGHYAEAHAAFARVERLPDGNKAHDAHIRLRKIERLMAAN